MNDNRFQHSLPLVPPEDEDHLAMTCVTEAFAEAILGGLDSACFARAAIVVALQEFVDSHGEEFVARFASNLPERIRQGEFTVSVRH